MVRTLVGAVILHPVVPDAVMGNVFTDSIVTPDSITDRVFTASLPAPDAVMGNVFMGHIAPDAIMAGDAAACVSGAIPHALMANALAVAAVPSVRVHIAMAVAVNVRVELVGLPRAFVHIVAERLGFRGLLVGLLAQSGCVHLGLLCIRPGARGFRFPLPRVKFFRLGPAADFRSLLPVFVIPLLLDRLPAPSACQQQQHDQHHHNNGNYHPNPWSCFQLTHHFPLDVTGRPAAFRLTLMELFITRLARVLTFY